MGDRTALRRSFDFERQRITVNPFVKDNSCERPHDQSMGGHVYVAYHSTRLRIFSDLQYYTILLLTSYYLCVVDIRNLIMLSLRMISAVHITCLLQLSCHNNKSEHLVFFTWEFLCKYDKFNQWWHNGEPASQMLIHQ